MPPSDCADCETEGTSESSDENSQEDSWSTTSSEKEQKNFFHPLIYHAALEIAFDEQSLLRKLFHCTFPSEFRVSVGLNVPSQDQARPTIIYHTFDKQMTLPWMERIRTKARMVLDEHSLFDVDVVVEICETVLTGGFAPVRDFDVWADVHGDWPIALPKVGANISIGPTEGYGTLSGYASVTGKWAGRFALTCFHCCYDKKSEVRHDYWSGYAPEDVARDKGNGVDLVPFWRREEEKLDLAEEEMGRRAGEIRGGDDLTQLGNIAQVAAEGDPQSGKKINGQQDSEIHGPKTDIWQRPLNVERKAIHGSKRLGDIYNLEEGEVTYPSRPATEETGGFFMPGKLGRVVMGSGSISIDDFEMDWALLKLDEQRMSTDMRTALNITPQLQLTEEQVRAFDEGLPEEEWLENTMPKEFLSNAPIIKGFRTMEQLKEAYYRKDESKLRVLKYGATTGWTVGRLSTFPSAYNDSRRNIVHGMSVVSLVEGEDFCIPGDGGSLVFDRYGHAVGIFCWYSGVFHGRMLAILMPVAIMLEHIWKLAGGKDDEKLEASFDYIQSEEEKVAAKKWAEQNLDPEAGYRGAVW